MRELFYDIESLSNVFTLALFDPSANKASLFYLIDQEELMSGSFISKRGKITPVNDPFKGGSFFEAAAARIYSRNKNFTGQLEFISLKTVAGCNHLAEIFGLTVASNAAFPWQPDNGEYPFPRVLRPVCTTDPNYDENIHPFLEGYNSDNYDLTMMACFFDLCYQKTVSSKTGKTIFRFVPPTASAMREINDRLFSDEFKNNMPAFLTAMENSSRQNKEDPRFRMHQAWLQTGRHIDIAKLNEKGSHLGLKRVLGYLGRQIMESEIVGRQMAAISTADELADLFAYNLSDVFNLPYVRYSDVYNAAFDLKKSMLKTYPELIYEKKKDEYAPAIHPYKVRFKRSLITASSASLASRIFCPYGKLDDMETVSFLYPSKETAKEKGIPQVNVLEESRKFFEKHFGSYPEAMAAFNEIYQYYKSLEGKNFNSSKHYRNKWINTASDRTRLYPGRVADIPKRPNNIVYYNSDGTPSAGFATFSTGGLHGAEYNLTLYQQDMAAYKEQAQLFDEVKEYFQTPTTLSTMEKHRGKLLLKSSFIKSDDYIENGQWIESDELEEGQPSLADIQDLFSTPDCLLAERDRQIKSMMKYFGSTSVQAQILRDKGQVQIEIGGKEINASDFIRSVKIEGVKTFVWKEIKKPELFIAKADGSTKLNPRYSVTSSADVIHEDFKSYYPNLLANMSAFHNDSLGYDRLAEVYGQKAEDDKKLKDSSLSNTEKDYIKLHRSGIKLLLNSASGAADTLYDLPIQMNNAVLSMRIIGQLFTWRIAQAQTLAGGTVISTNTDGLYVIMKDEEKGQRVLDEESKNIGIEIDPESLYLISKDANNRLEIADGKIINTSGSHLAHASGPDLSKSLDHPALIDYALAKYLSRQRNHVEQPFDETIGMEILNHAKDTLDPVQFLIMAQTIVSISKKSMSYNFAYKQDVNDAELLQHYNRAFILKDESRLTRHLKKTTAKKITEAVSRKRQRNSEREFQHDPVALKILEQAGITSEMLEASSKEASIEKITGIDPEWNMFIYNGSLYELDQRQKDFLLQEIDLNQYLKLLKDVYENNWRN